MTETMVEVVEQYDFTPVQKTKVFHRIAVEWLVMDPQVKIYDLAHRVCAKAIQDFSEEGKSV